MDILVNVLRGLFGMAVLLGICYLLSADRKKIKWRTVLMGMALQIVLAVLILWVGPVEKVFEVFANFFVKVLQFTEAGANFVLGSWPDDAWIQATDYAETPPSQKLFQVGYVFAFKVLPTIIFFAALSSLLYYLGVLQVIIKAFAWVMVRTMKLTGAESLAAAANIFIGQTEAPLIVKPYLEKMSRSEILCLMTGGMATIAGGVFAAYVGFLGGSNEAQQLVFAKHLLTASIISAPAAIVAAKMLFPEQREVDLDNQKLDIPSDEAGSNMLDAISRGTTDGIKLAVNVGAMLLVFTALVAMVNYGLELIGGWTQLNGVVERITDGQFSKFSLEFILGILFAPIAWILGIPASESMAAGQLLGLKTTLNEFYAYAQLPGIRESAQLSDKTVRILTYALCGFANFASIGIQIGGIGAIAPGQRKALSELGIKALIGGTIAAFFTAAIAGMLYF